MLSLRHAHVGDEHTVVTVVPAELEEGSDEKHESAASSLSLALVLDISGSMQAEVTAANADGEHRHDGLTQLDLVKHSCLTIIAGLRATDQLTVVSFSNHARVEFELAAMTDDNKKRAVAAVQGLQVEGMTNLFDGLIHGLQQLQQAPRHNIQKVYLLTDGQPNSSPPRGIMHGLRLWLDSNSSDHHSSVHTFGFGYNLDTTLLEQLAVETGGQFAFIPDGGFVGTCFINALASTCAMVARDAVIKIESASPVSLVGDLKHSQASWGTAVLLGDVTDGQPRSIVVRGKLPATAFSLEYDDLASEKAVQVFDVNNDDDGEAAQHVSRLEACEALRGMIEAKSMDERKAILEKVLESIKKRTDDFPNEWVSNGLVGDLEGQVTIAVSKDEFWNRWGDKYLRCLLGAHQQQVCVNFKDVGLQIYGGAHFKMLQDRFEKAFISLPPPQPSTRAQRHSSSRGRGGGGSSSGGGAARGRVSMRSYLDSSGVCFVGDTRILLADGRTRRPVALLKQGDRVWTPDGPTTVRCLVRTPDFDGKLVRVNGRLLITPWHPVIEERVWQFPALCDNNQLLSPEQHGVTQVFNLVLDAHHVVDLDGVRACTLGHGIVDNEVIRHPYFGSARVIDDLKKLEGWNMGSVNVRTIHVRRSKATKLVTAW